MPFKLISILFLSFISFKAYGEKVYYFAYGKTYKTSEFHFKDMTKEQTNAVIKNACAEMSAVSGLKIKPWSGKGPYHVIFDFYPKVTYNAIAVTKSKSGKAWIQFSNTRNSSVRIAMTAVQHELFHKPIGYRASPSADKWGHAVSDACIFSIQNVAQYFCAPEIAYLRKRFGI